MAGDSHKILAADVLIFGTPIWMGQPSSIAKRAMERMDAFLSETDDAGRTPAYGKVAVFAIVGNEDGAHFSTAAMAQSLNDVGWTIPAASACYWVGEAMNKKDFKDLSRRFRKVTEKPRRWSRRTPSTLPSCSKASLIRRWAADHCGHAAPPLNGRHEQHHFHPHAHPRLRPGRPHRRHLRRPRRPGADRRPGHPARRPAHHHHRRRKLSRLPRRHPGPLADGADADAGRACRRADGVGPYRRGRPVAAPVPAERRQRRLSWRHAGDRHRRPGEMAQPAVRGAYEGQGRLGLRDLRRLLLPRQEGGGDRRRQHRGRGSALHDQPQP